MPAIGRGAGRFNEDTQSGGTGRRRGHSATLDAPQFVGSGDIGSDLEARGLNEFNAANERFSGVNEALFNQSNQVGLSQAVEQSGQTAEDASFSQERSIQRRQESLGLNLTDRQKRSQGRSLNLTRELAKASAKGSTRRGFRDRAEIAQRAGGSFEDQAFAIESGVEVGLANAAGQEAIRAADAKAAKKARRNSIIGSVIGVGAMVLMSDENVKLDKRPVRGSLLEKLKKVRVEKWKYMGEDTDHIGPYAQEFNDAFGVGQDDGSKISVIDALGITLGAVKELNEKIDG